MQKRFSRQEPLIGKNGIKKLSKSKIAIIGIGGVGSYTVEALARAGVGHIILIDHDIIDITNINRQIHALDSTVGLPKVEVMRQRLLDINPEIKVDVFQKFISKDVIEKILKKDMDYVVDAIDTIKSKVSLILYCKKNNIPIISAMGAGNKLDPSCFKVADISETSMCPVARVVRRQLRKHNINKGVKVVYSEEEPIKTSKTSSKSKQIITGSISFVPPVVGMIMAGVVIRDILNV